MQGSKCHGNLWNLVLLKKILERHHWLVNPLKFIRNNMGRCVSKAFNGRDNNSQFVFVFFTSWIYLFILNLFILSESEVAQSCPALCNPMDCSLPGSSVHGDSPGKNTRVGCHALLQGIFPTQGSNPGLPALQADALPSEPLCLGYLIEG